MSEKFSIKGIVHNVSPTKQVSEKFSKRDFVVTTEVGDKYPQLVSFQATGDRCSLLDPLRAGDDVTVHFNLRGREWKSPSGEVKYFNTLDAWRIEHVVQPGRPAASPETDELPF